MRQHLWIIVRAAGACCGLACLAAGGPPAAQPPDEAVLRMVDELVSSPDRDMRGLGLKQVREGLPGEAATRHFAELASKLPPPAQAAVLEALGDRGDRAARPAVLKALASPEEPVRAAALRAIGPLGDAADVPLLAEKAATGAAFERPLARHSLVRLPGEKVTAAIIDAMGKSPPAVQVVLLGVLADRNAKQASASVLERAGDGDRSVRLAALAAARGLAAQEDLPKIIRILAVAKDDAERQATEAVLLAVCGRGGQDSVEAVALALKDADGPTRIALLRALAATGSPKALTTIVGRLEDDEPSVRDEAMRLLSLWPDAVAVPYLRKIAQEPAGLNQRVLAIRGLVRLGLPQGDRPADLAALGAAMEAAERPEEKRLVLSALGSIPTPASLALAVSAIEDPALAEEASLAAVAIAEKLPAADHAEVRAAMKRVLERSQQPAVRQRAERLLKGS